MVVGQLLILLVAEVVARWEPVHPLRADSQHHGLAALKHTASLVGQLSLIPQHRVGRLGGVEAPAAADKTVWDYRAVLLFRVAPEEPAEDR